MKTRRKTDKQTIHLIEGELLTVVLPNGDTVEVGAHPRQLVRIDMRESEWLHQMGGMSVATLVIHRGKTESRSYLRARIPDDPRGGKEGEVHVICSGIHKTRNVEKEVRAPWVNFSPEAGK